MRRDRSRRRRLHEDRCHPMERGIVNIVEILKARGVDVVDACAGGYGHVSEFPFVSFFEDDDEKALEVITICQEEGIPILRLSKEYRVLDEIVGPYWDIGFYGAFMPFED